MNPNGPGYPHGGPQPGQANAAGQSNDWMSKLTTLGKGVGTALFDVTKAGIKVVNKALDQTPKDWMRTGVVIQLVSRSTGRCLQILQSPDGRLIVDGLGAEGPHFYNSHFTVISDGQGHHGIYLHNNFNYLAIVDGIAQLYSAGPNGASTPICLLKVRQPAVGGAYVVLESDSEKGRYIAILQNGMLKSALVTNLMDNDSQFAVRVIYSPYPTQPSA